MIATLILQMILGAIFLFAGIQKIMGSRQQAEMFKDLKLPRWFQTVTGYVELTGVVWLIIGFWLPGVLVIAGLWFGFTMLGAMIAHLRVQHPVSEYLPALIFLVISITLGILQFFEMHDIIL